MRWGGGGQGSSFRCTIVLVLVSLGWFDRCCCVGVVCCRVGLNGLVSWGLGIA